MSAVLARVTRLDNNLVLQLQIRAIENRHPQLHEDLVDWGRWGRSIGARAEISRPGIWSLPGDYDPDLDPDATPEAPRAPLNEKRINELDTRIGDLDNFATAWRRVLAINYIGAKSRTGFYILVPEWQRPREAGVSDETYRLALSESLRVLADLA